MGGVALSKDGSLWLDGMPQIKPDISKGRF